MKLVTAVNSPVARLASSIPCKYAEKFRVLSPLINSRPLLSLFSSITVPEPSVIATPAPLAVPVIPNNVLIGPALPAAGEPPKVIFTVLPTKARVSSPGPTGLSSSKEQFSNKISKLRGVDWPLSFSCDFVKFHIFYTLL